MHHLMSIQDVGAEIWGVDGSKGIHSLYFKRMLVLRYGG